jgi:hypothetical protein
VHGTGGSALLKLYMAVIAAVPVLPPCVHLLQCDMLLLHMAVQCTEPHVGWFEVAMHHHPAVAHLQLLQACCVHAHG